MKYEIKEINIKIPGQILDYVDTKEHLLDLFNYITNLQERNEKAIEYITNNDELYYGDELYDSYQIIINILQGEDKDDTNSR